MLEAIYGDDQFVVLCGLNPEEYTDTQNVIIHAGLSSHIGSRRGLAGHEGGDNTAVRKLNRFSKLSRAFLISFETTSLP